MTSLVWWNRLAFFLLCLGAIILAFTLTLQPKVSDDLYLLWGFQKSAGALDWIRTEYNGMTGRVWIILLTTFVSPHPLLEAVYRSLIVVEIAFLGALAWYCALGHGAWNRSRENLQAIAIFSTLLWFALPDRAETVAWLVGNYAYLVPALFGLAFIAWFERASVDSSGDSNAPHPLAFNIVSFLLGFCAGISHEQIVATCVTYCALVMLPMSRRYLLERETTAPRIWIGAAGLIFGAAVLVSAPSNFSRMAIYAAPSLSQIFERMALFLSGAYFDMGTETVGKYIWLGALVLTLLFFNRNADKREIAAGLKRGVFWLMISIVSLLAMTPATNFISTRTAFFAIIFLYVAVAAMSCRPQSIAGRGDRFDGQATTEQMESRFFLSTAVLAVLGCLVIVESVATLISNVSVAAEVARRDDIVKKAILSSAAGDKSPIRVPFIATQTAPLSYIQNPQHDREFLFNWGKAIGRTIEHDVSAGAPLPNSLNPLKAIKFRQ